MIEPGGVFLPECGLEGVARDGAGGSGRASAARTPGPGGGTIDLGWFVGSASPSLRSGLRASWMLGGC